MEENNNISFKHSLESYNKKYKNRRHRILKYTKKQVEEFDAKYKGKLAKNYLLKGKKWTLIGDTYYEIPKAPTFTWFRNLKASTQVITSVLVGGGMVTAVAVPVSINLRNIKNVFDVSFEIDPSSFKQIPIPETQKVKKGEKATEPELSTRGKTFKGWYDKATGQPYDFNSVVNRDIILVAKFSDEQCTVTFDLNGGKFKEQSHIPVNKFALNSLIDKPKFNPIKDDQGLTKFAFSGWTKTKDADDYWDFSTDKTTGSSLTLYAKWKSSEETNIYVVNFYVDGTITQTVNVIGGEVVIKPQNPTKDNSQFKFWTITDGGSEEYDFSKGVVSNLNLYARFDECIDSIKIVGDHNIDCDSQELTKFTVVNASNPGENALNGITWSSNNEDLLKIGTDGTPTVDKTKLSSTGGNKVVVHASKTYTISGVTYTVQDDFDVEVGSFGYFNEDYLAEGCALAKKTVTTPQDGRIFIPSRYFVGDDPVDITKIGQSAFQGKNDIHVYIPIPTIIIEKDAFKDVSGLNLTFADTTNTWFFNDQEIVPDSSGIQTIIAALILGTDSSKAPTSKGLKFTLKDDGTYSVCLETEAGKTFAITDLLIPAYYYEDSDGGHTRYKEGKSKKVTELAKRGQYVGAFDSDTDLKSITFHSECNLESIGDYAFSKCSNLAEVYFDDKAVSSNGLKLKTIGTSAFSNCDNLKQITIPKCVETIKDFAFSITTQSQAAPYKGLNSITISEGVRTIERFAFKNNYDLSSVHFADKGLEEIKDGVFYDCINLEQIKLPFTLTTIGDNAFYVTSPSTQGLKTVDFVDNTSEWVDSQGTEKIRIKANLNIDRTENATALKNISGYWLVKAENPSITDYFTFTKSGDGYIVSSYDSSGMDTLSVVNIPASYTVNGVTYPIIGIAPDTFNNNKDIQKVSIPNTIKRIETDTFKGCSNLNTVIIPESVNFIGKHAFRSCNSLTYVDFGSKNCKFSYSKYLPDVEFLNNSTEANKVYNALLLIGNNITNFSVDLTRVS